MPRSEPRLAWTTPAGAAVPDPLPRLSRADSREALWGLVLSVAVHIGLLIALGSIVLAARIATQEPVIEVAVVAAADAQPTPPADPAAATAQAPAPPDPPPSPPEQKASDAALPEAPAGETAPRAPPGEIASDVAAKPAETPPKPEEPKPRAAPPPRAERPAVPEAPPQIAARPPTLQPGRGAKGSANALPTEMGAAANLKAVVSPPPKYPPIALQLREEGTVNLIVEIGADGSPKEITVQKSSGFGSLDEEAIRTLRQWRFSPPLKDGQAASVKIYIPLVFKLKHDGGGVP